MTSYQRKRWKLESPSGLEVSNISWKWIENLIHALDSNLAMEDKFGHEDFEQSMSRNKSIHILKWSKLPKYSREHIN